MKLLCSLIFLLSFTAHADVPFISVKDRLRLDLWTYGIKKPMKVLKRSQHKEEIERPLRNL